MKYTIFVDESGTLPDPSDLVVVVAAVGTDLSQRLSQITVTIRKQIAKKQKSLPEIGKAVGFGQGRIIRRIENMLKLGN